MPTASSTMIRRLRWDACFIYTIDGHMLGMGVIAEDADPGEKWEWRVVKLQAQPLQTPEMSNPVSAADVAASRPPKQATWNNSWHDSVFSFACF